jgi:DNA-binding Lrp family transcriptional regulator
MSNLIKILLREGLFVDAAINEIADELDFSSFKVKKILNPEVWESEDVMNPDIKDLLIRIANNYYSSLDLNVKISDIILTGSLANYNWSKYSDFDVHILIDTKKFGDKETLIKDLLDAKTRSWNDSHDIKIKGYDVELYLQSVDQEHHSTGVYSLMNEEWVVKPEKLNPRIDKNSVREKYKKIVDILDDIKKQYKNGNEEVVANRLQKLKDRIKKMRQVGLESGGEFSSENIAFKLLRRNEIMTQIGELMDKAYDKSMSLDEWLAQ